jgi:hypothetical protein
MSETRMTILAAGLALIVVALGFGITAICIDRREKPKATRPGQHSRRGQRRAARAAQRAEDDQTVAWLAGLKRRVPAAAIARARVAGLLAVLPDRRPAAPPCPQYEEDPAAGWMTAPGPWDTGEARAELVPLPPVPVDLGDMAARYADLFDRHGPHPRPAPDVTIVDLKLIDAGPPPGDLDQWRRQLAAAMNDAYDGPNAAAGNWAPRTAIPGPVLDWDPAIDDSGLIHLRYPWADQVVADFDWAPVSRG